MTTHAGGNGASDRDAPPADAEEKPDSPLDLKSPTRKFILKNTFREFLDDECTDLAAGLTYYAVLSLFPAILALVSILGLVGQSKQTTSMLMDILRGLGADRAVSTIQPVVEQLTRSQSAGFALVIGLVMAFWSASGYVNAFSRAMNRVYEVQEGRPIWKLRPVMLGVTALVLLLVALTAVGLVISGPLAKTIGGVIGLSSVAVTVWSIAKWPVMLFIVIFIVAVLYHLTPNIRQPKFRWLSIGAVVAILTWVVVSVAFGFYVANFSNYNKTYGSLGGVIVFLLWIWLTNLALLFGAELDAEMERGRELQAGLPAEEEIQLPPRDTSKIDKDAKKEEKAIDEARELREEAAAADET
ncbi:YihY/virulence factor BrkB family protein [Actinopolymorpha singaporensis]|uniref:Membrane protein n=1 Tax=Actinopolymorpha singaporensis TaxID=117157 RepID=A0A1H1NYQ6_9ACTN|nr:YihY/virulence factor BrkB family protein [Actinopolymorpha singaporensis]SDS04108.1 membrane protein [Actinopolymorpha singaporensis]